MDLRRCPKCKEREVRLLDVPSQNSRFWFFHCNGCRHSWNVPKDDADVPPQEATAFRRKM